MLRHLFRQILGWQLVLRPIVNFIVPVTLTEVERDAVDGDGGSGGRASAPIPTPVAAACVTNASGTAG